MVRRLSPSIIVPVLIHLSFNLNGAERTTNRQPLQVLLQSGRYCWRRIPFQTKYISTGDAGKLYTQNRVVQ